MSDLELTRADARWFVVSLDVVGALECLRCGDLVGANERARRKHREDHIHRDERHSTQEVA